MSALLLDLIRHRCGGTVFFVEGEPACRCVAPDAVAARRVDSPESQAWALLHLVRKLHEIDGRPGDGSRVEIGDGATGRCGRRARAAATGP